MQQTLFEITGTTPQAFVDNIVNFFVQRGWKNIVATEGLTYPIYNLQYKNMVIGVQNDGDCALNLNFYYANTHPDLVKIYNPDFSSYKINTLYTMRIRYIENKFFCYVEFWSYGYNSNSKDSIFSFNTKDALGNNTINYFGRRYLYDGIDNPSEDITFKIASELDENYPDKYAFATYLKPIATTNSKMLMTKNGVPLVDANLGINKGEVLGTRILMGATKNKTYKIGEEYWFCFYPNYVALIEEKELITESEETN